jgi:hypothetical protein
MDIDSSSTSPTQSQDWQLILHASNQLVLYNPTSHALSIRHTSSHPPCPYCHRPLPSSFLPDDAGGSDGASRVSNYFQLLATANERSAMPPQLDVPVDDDAVEEGGDDHGNDDEGHPRAFKPEAMAKGYFRAFFQELYKLGMGANGSVFLCQVSTPVGPFLFVYTKILYLSHEARSRWEPSW